MNVERRPIMASGSGVKPQKEINRLKVQVRKIERDRDKLFPDLGKQLYQAFLEGRVGDPALARACEQVGSLDDQVAGLNARVSELQSQVERMKAGPAATSAVSCPSCGAAAAPGARFCGNCGAAMPHPARFGSTCPSCAQPVAEGARFCPGCGSQVSAAGAAVGPAAVPPPPPPGAESTAPGIEAAPVAGGARKCASCGAAVEEADAAFCGECGSRLG